MPIYEYQCRGCGHQLECFRKISDDPLKDCPACNKPDLVKKVSATSFRLKGTGWYATDFKASGKKSVTEDKAKGKEQKDKQADKTKAEKTTSKEKPKSEAKE